MVILALFCRRFTFFTKLFLPRFQKKLMRRALSGNFCNTQGERSFCSYIQARAIYTYTDGLLKLRHRRLTYSAQGSQHLVKSRQEMQENGKSIQSYQLDGPNFSMLFCSRENRQENVLDSTGSHGLEQNLNLKTLARRKVFSSKTKIRGFFAKQGWDRSRNQKVGMKYFMLRLCPLNWWVQSYLATWC